MSARLKKNIDMTEGPIARRLIQFAMPLLVGNIFQQFYNMVDTWVIGQTGDNAAYAAVGSIGPILNTMIGFFMGFSSGAGIVIAQFYGAKNKSRVSDTVHTAMTVTLIMAALLTVLGVLITPFMISLVLDGATAENGIFTHAYRYLIIQFLGITTMLIYNMCSGILQAIGDSKRPLYFLVVSALVNIVLDLVFVFGCNMGAAGVSLATVIAQLVSAILGIIAICRADPETGACFSPRRLKIDFPLLKRILLLALPTALATSIGSLSNVFVQAYIAGADGNQTVNLGAWTSYAKIEGLMGIPITALSLAVSTFVAQNLGNGDLKRAKKGTYTALGLSIAFTALVAAIVIGFATPLARIFNPDGDVVSLAARIIRYHTPLYFFCSGFGIFSAGLRGSGNTLAPMIYQLIGMVGFRQIYLFTVSNYFSNDLLTLSMGYPYGWIFTFICAITVFYTYGFSKKKTA